MFVSKSKYIYSLILFLSPYFLKFEMESKTICRIYERQIPWAFYNFKSAAKKPLCSLHLKNKESYSSYA